MRSLKGQFLVASSTLQDANFRSAVVLMLQHDEQGALGVIINRPLEITIRQACQQVMEIDCDIPGPLHQGGPCEAILLVLHSQPDFSDAEVVPGLSFTTDTDVVRSLLMNPPDEVKFIIGYSGWGAGQLDEELKSGSWLVVPATAARVFDPPPNLWHRLVTESNLSKWIDPSKIPEDPTVN